jgi:pimeloyl-ACP methyl ester carboxylesterase
MGAYFSLLAYKNEPLEQAFFLSPVVNMLRIIENMMQWFGVSEERLKAEQEISTPIGKTLYWNYYQYVKANPIAEWNIPTSILYGENDEVSEFDMVSGFARKFHCDLTVMDKGEHFFHTDEQLAFFGNWLERIICQTNGFTCIV